MRLLAIDYGTKRLGLAWADTTLGAVLPFGLITADTMTKKIQQVAKLLATERVERLVIGFPLGLDGRENKNTERVKQFSFALQKYTAVPVEWFDERLSTRAAAARGGTISRDEAAAMVILEGYLARARL